MTETELVLLAALLAAWGLALVTYLPTIQIRRKHEELGITEALRDAYKLPVIRPQTEKGTHAEAVSD